MKKIVNTKNLTYEEWLLYRNKGIGGSDAGAVAGLSPFKSPAEVYLEKISDTVEKIDNERMRIGRDLEDYVAVRFEEATGKKVRRNNYLMAHDEFPFMQANIDREVVGENAILECKTTNSYAKKDWEGDKIPPYYEIQCLHYMAVTGAERAYIAVLIGNEQFLWKTIERDEETIKALITIEKDFWQNNVEKREAPEPDGSKSYSKILDDKYKNSIENTIDLTSEENKKQLERLDEIKEFKDALSKEEEQIKQVFKKQMQENDTAYIDERKITWKSFERTNFDKKQFEKDNPELLEKYTKTSTYKRFSIN